jgi:hypothetical protein
MRPGIAKALNYTFEATEAGASTERTGFGCSCLPDSLECSSSFSEASSKLLLFSIGAGSATMLLGAVANRIGRLGFVPDGWSNLFRCLPLFFDHGDDLLKLSIPAELVE